MTTRTISFHFDKQAGSSDLCFIDAREGSAIIPVNRDDISYAVSSIFEKMIAYKAQYEAPILSFNAFTVTLVTNSGLSHSRLDIDPMNPTEVPFRIETLKTETAKLFFKAIPSLQPVPAPAASPAIAEQRPQELELQPDNPFPSLSKQLPEVEEIAPLSPVGFVPDDHGGGLIPVEIPAAAAADPQAAPSSASPVMSVPAPQANAGKDVLEVLSQPKSMENPTQNEMFTEIYQQMDNRLNTMVKRDLAEQTFGIYLMARLFEKVKSHHYNFETGEFTLIFDKAPEFDLTKLPNFPEGTPLTTRIGVGQLQNSTLIVAKQVKGRFVDEKVVIEAKEYKIKKVAFEPGSLILRWPPSWTSWSETKVELREFYETQGNTITMKIDPSMYGQNVLSIPAQIFADFVECNLSNTQKGAQ